MAAQLTKDQAEAAIVKVVSVLEEEATQAKLLAIVGEVSKLPAEQQQMAKMMQLLPAVQEATAPVMAEYGYQAGGGMAFMMQLQQHAAASPIVKEGVAKLQATMAGKAPPPPVVAGDEAELQQALATSMAAGEAPPMTPREDTAAVPDDAEAAAAEAAPAVAAAPEVEPLTFRVTHRKDVLKISMQPTATVAELHLKLEELTGIMPVMQKVMFKGGLKDKTKTLEEVGIKSGVKMMLVGSKQDDVAKLAAGKAAVAKEPTPEAVAAAEKTPVCHETAHKRVIDKGKPSDAEAGVACPPGAHATLPENLKGILNGSGAKVRLVFPPGAAECTFATAERTQKFALGQFPEVTSDAILEHPGYRILGVKMGKTEKSFVYLYWVPEQYVNAIRAALTGRGEGSMGGGGRATGGGGGGGQSAQDMEEEMLAEAIRRSMEQ